MQFYLKIRFFSDLNNTQDCYLFLDKTALNLRFKLNNASVVNPNMLLFYQFGIYQSSNLQNRTYEKNILELPYKQSLSSPESLFNFFTETTNKFNFNMSYSVYAYFLI
jgi:hypothetical protein